MLRWSLVVFLSIVGRCLFAQDIEHKMEQMELFWQQNPQEKIYVHTDRSAYTAGEDLWFKIYNTIGVENTLSILSNINYLELIGPKNDIVQSQIIAVEAGVGNGSITLADTLVEGTYRLRAYTNWMRNDSTDYFFEKKIAITNGRSDNVLTSSSRIDEGNTSFYSINLTTIDGEPLHRTSVRYQFIEEGKVVDRGSSRTDESGELRIKVSNKNQGHDLHLSFTNINQRPVSKVIHTNLFDSDNSLQVFPEGGHILAGHLNKIAVKALRPNGLGIKATIELVNGQDSVRGSVETNDLGMGVLSFFPNADEQYRLKVRFEDGTAKYVEMPMAEQSGMSLMVNNQNTSRVYAQVNVSEDLLSEQEIYFVVHHYGMVYYVSKQKIEKSNMVFSTPKEQLPTGVLTVSILNESFVPIFERPIFNYNPSHSLPIEVAIEKSTFATREKINTDLTVGHAQDTSNVASLSASVVNLSKLSDTTDLQANIISTLLVESDLKGYIESPGYYLDNEGNINLSELDYLLLTQGWRKIPWDALGLIDVPKKYEPEKSLTIKGYTRKLGRKSAEPNAEVQLIPTDDFMTFLDTISTDDGFFVFDNLIFADSTKFLISAKDKRGRNNIDIVVEEESVPTIDRLKSGANDLNTLYNKELSGSKQFFTELERKGLMPNTIEIEEVTVSGERKKAPEHSRNLNGPGNADQIITWEDLETCPTLEMCLNGRLMGVIFQAGIPYNTRGMAPMQVILDGMYVEADMLMSIPVMDVASVEVLRNVNYTSIYGSYGGNGVLVITTKIGSEGRVNYTPKGLLSLQPRGITIPMEFYKPIYEIDSEQTFTNDLRTTIHWEPMIVSDREGQASFDFYTSDEAGTYRMVIEGIDIQGRIGRKVVEFEVRD